MSKSKTKTGNDWYLNEDTLLLLLETYYESSVDSLDRQSLKDAILKEFDLSLEILALKYSQTKCITASYEDMYQQGAEIILGLIETWSPLIEGTIGGYFRKGIIFKFIDLWRRRMSRREREQYATRNSLLGVKEMTKVYLEKLTEEQTIRIYKKAKANNVWVSYEEQQAYLLAVDYILVGRGSFWGLVTFLVKEYSCTQYRATLIASHALVTIRIEFFDDLKVYRGIEERINSTEVESLGKRFMELSNKYSFEELMIIFQGLTVRFPGTKLDTCDVYNQFNN